MINGYGCFLKYLAIKSHFLNEKYDYFTYNGKVRANISTFNKRNDKYFFEKLAKLLKTEEEVEKFFVSNFVSGSNLWIGNALEEQSIDTYKKWLKKYESLTYKLKSDLTSLLDEDFKTLFEVNSGQHPKLLKKLLNRKIVVETLIILNSVYPFMEQWNKDINERFVWTEAYKRMKKYEPFLIKFIGVDNFKRHINTTKNLIIESNKH